MELPTTLLPHCLAHLLILVFLELSLITRCNPYVSGLPEFGHQINWAIEHGGGVMELPSFRHFVKSWGMGVHGCYLKWGQFWDIKLQNVYSLPRFPLWIKLPCGTPSVCLGNWILFLETPHIWCQVNPSNSPLCFGSSGACWARGVMEEGHAPISYYLFSVFSVFLAE